jgi:hypothetical protein
MKKSVTKGVGPARKELRVAHAALERMKRASTFTEFEAAWQDALTRIERAWNKMRGAFADSAYEPWRGNHASLRKTDPLLRYVSHARDAEEHTVADTLSHEPGTIAINPASGHSLHIDELAMAGGVMSLKSPQAIKVTIQPGRASLLPATTRGVTYQPPTEHCGRPLERTDPVYIAERAIEYYEQLLADSESRFGENRAGKA